MVRAEQPFRRHFQQQIAALAFSVGPPSKFSWSLLFPLVKCARTSAQMTIEPSSLDELRGEMAAADARGEKVSHINLRALDRVVDHTPEDMTVTVEAGITLARLQSELARRRQWLPIDPPRADTLTVEAALATNASGPRRFGYGVIRDYLIGIKVVFADGRVIKSGGKVVKNVAGYDLAKLFIGSHGSLGVIVEATFKLRPLPEVERFIQARCESLDEARAGIESVLDSDVTPVVLDLHNLSSTLAAGGSSFSLVAGFAGTAEDVRWQSARANELGWSEPATLDYEKNFWSDEPVPHRISVLPSRLVETVRSLGDVPFVARAGNGVIYCRGGAEPPKNGRPIKLTQRLKDAFDPKGILPEPPP